MLNAMAIQVVLKRFQDKVGHTIRRKDVGNPKTFQSLKMRAVVVGISTIDAKQRRQVKPGQ